MRFAALLLLSGATASPAPLSLNGVDLRAPAPLKADILCDVIGDIEKLFAHSGPVECGACKVALRALKTVADVSPSLLSDIFKAICLENNARSTGICKSLEQYTPRFLNVFNFVPDIVNMLHLMDPEGLDGEYFCHYMLGGACPLPATPKIDYSQYWPPAPSRYDLPTSKNRTFRVAHVSDIHLQSTYAENSEAHCNVNSVCCKSDSVLKAGATSQKAGKFGSYLCDAPQLLVDNSLQVLRNTSEFDFALFTGDMVDHDPVLTTKELTYEEEEGTLKALKDHLGGIPVFPTLGNHDSFPYAQDAAPWTGYANLYTYNTELMRHLWGSYGWLPEDSLNQVSETHGAYSVMAKDRLKVISINSNFYYRYNFYNYARMDEPELSGILKFLVDELLDCERRGLRAWVISHVPPGGVVDEALPVASEFLGAAFERFAPTIAGLFFGHTHRDEFTVLYKNNATSKAIEDALHVAWVAPSVTPFTNFNPSWRYYEVDADTYEIMDSLTHFAAIDPFFNEPWSQIDDNALAWQFEYSAREHYGPLFGWPADEPLTGQFWHNVAARIFDDQGLTDDYVKLAFRDSPTRSACDAACQADLWCYATSFTVPQAVACRQAAPNVSHNAIRAVPGYPMPRRDRQ